MLKAIKNFLNIFRTQKAAGTAGPVDIRDRPREIRETEAVPEENQEAETALEEIRETEAAPEENQEAGKEPAGGPDLEERTGEAGQSSNLVKALDTLEAELEITAAAPEAEKDPERATAPELEAWKEEMLRRLRNAGKTY